MWRILILEKSEMFLGLAGCAVEDTRCIHNNGDQCNIAQRGRRDARIDTNTNVSRNTNTNANTNTNTNVVADGKGR